MNEPKYLKRENSSGQLNSLPIMAREFWSKFYKLIHSFIPFRLLGWIKLIILDRRVIWLCLNPTQKIPFFLLGRCMVWNSRKPVGQLAKKVSRVIQKSNKKSKNKKVSWYNAYHNSYKVVKLFLAQSPILGWKPRGNLSLSLLDLQVIVCSNWRLATRK